MGHACIGRRDVDRGRGGDGQSGYGERQASGSSRNGHAGWYSGNRCVTAGEGDDGTARGGRSTQRDAARGGGPAIDAGWIQRERGEGWCEWRVRGDDVGGGSGR